MTKLIISAFILGLVGAIIPGPVLAATFTRILQAGFYKSLSIILWALIVETVVALASLIVLTSMAISNTFFSVLSLFGSGILVWIATQLWRVRKLDSGERVYFGLGKLSAMVLLNGVLWTYWITVCVPQAVMLGTLIHYGEYLFLMIVQIGWLLSTLMAALAFAQIRGLLSNPRVVPVVFKSFALIFLYFALNMAYTSTLTILNR